MAVPESRLKTKDDRACAPTSTPTPGPLPGDLRLAELVTSFEVLIEADFIASSSYLFLYLFIFIDVVSAHSSSL